jgi:ATP-dependent RNA helicase DOB1
LQCLFATETFAMGLNMPAKTVIFTQLKKWDGEQTRFLSSGEYIQMSGRAGRRGKDDRGYALLVADDSLEESTCKEMLRGSAMPLLSSFKLTYYTLLNLMRRVEGTGADMEYVISRSFSQFQHEKRVPEMMDRLKTVQADIKALDSTSEEDAREYLRVKKQADRAQVTVLRAMLQPERCVHFLRTGRIVRVAHGDTDWGYGVVVSVQRLDGSAPPSAPESYIVDTLLCCGTHGPNGQPAPASLEDPGASMQVVPVSLPLLTALSTLRVAIPKDLKDAEPRRAVLTTLREAVGRYPDKRLPELDPTDLGVKDASALEAAAAVRRARSRLAELSERCRDAPGGPGDEKPVGTNNIEDPLRQKARLLTEADSLERQMRASQLSTFQEESRARIDVLRKLGHISDEEVVTLKGRAASEVDTGDELLASELMFNGTFGSLNKHQLAALVSCLVPVEEARGDVTVQAELADPLRQLQDTARHIAEVSLECKLEIDAGKATKIKEPQSSAIVI